MLTRICGLVVIALSVSPAAACCDQRGCDAVNAPVAAPALRQGIAGAVSYADDTNGDLLGLCFECRFSSATLTTFVTEIRVTDSTTAQAIVSSDAEREDVVIDGTYEAARDVGQYLACSFFGGLGECAPFEVDAGAVTTVGVSTSFGGRRVVVFGPRGARENTALKVQGTVE